MKRELGGNYSVSSSLAIVGGLSNNLTDLPRRQVLILPEVLEAAERVHSRFGEKIREWADLVEREGIEKVRRLRQDHKLANFRGQKREHIWSTQLNHRYRVFYEVMETAVRVIALEKHNKQRY